ncbi:cupin domain-containing protein [Bradyrhizobium manausense]
MSTRNGILQLPALDPATVLPSTEDPDYPKEFWGPVIGAERRRLGDAAGLKNFGVNIVRLPPGHASSQRHWHTKQDEFVFILEGQLTLVSEAGEQLLNPGMAAGFPAGKPDGHHVINRGSTDAVFLEIGDRSPGDEGEYPDIDMRWKNVDGDQRYIYVHKDGTPY